MILVAISNSERETETGKETAKRSPARMKLVSMPQGIVKNSRAISWALVEARGWRLYRGSSSLPSASQFTRANLRTQHTVILRAVIYCTER